jgi:serine/threonine protein kinase
MASAEIVGPHTFRFLNRILNKGHKLKMLNSIEDDLLKSFLSTALEEDPYKRATITQLLEHSFFGQDLEHDNLDVKFSKVFSDLISEQATELNTQRLKVNSRPKL